MAQKNESPPLFGVIKNLRGLLQRRDLTRNEQKRYESELEVLVRRLVTEESMDTLESVSHEFQELSSGHYRRPYPMPDPEPDPSSRQ